MHVVAQDSEENQQQQRSLCPKIARVLDEVRISQATSIRKIKELAAIRSSSPPLDFFAAFSKALSPIFDFRRRTASAERIIKFVSIFACTRSVKDAANCDDFLEKFLRFLIVAASAANKTTRFRACVIVSEIIMRLPDDAEVDNELWDIVIECIKSRVSDKDPAVRTFAVRALSRFANDSENIDILNLFIQKLPLEQNAAVRKAFILSLPPSSDTLTMIIDCTLDVNESVRKAAYCVLGSKFPIQSLSIKFRTIILQRGLSDRSTAVVKECFKLLKDEWLEKCCGGDPIVLLRFLDVETYESIGESVMWTLLNEELIKLQHGQTICQFLASQDDTTEARNHHQSVELMDSEVALFWKMTCKHLQMKAQRKGSDAAMTTGTESSVYASEASDSNDLLDMILPPSISLYVELVNAHIIAGLNHRFASRQLLLLGTVLDFSDSSNRKVASDFVQDLLHRPLDHELDDSGNEVVIGDGINLGGERDWAAAVAELSKKVHAATGEFDEVVLAVVEELSRPCRERTADCKQWLHCLAVIALLLENTNSLRYLHRGVIDPSEILHSVLLPGAKNANLDVQRASIRCLGLFGLLQGKPSNDLIKQLRCSFVKGPCSLTIMASKALLDLGIWHGPDEIDRAMNCNLSSYLRHQTTPSVEFDNVTEDLDIELLDLLYVGLENSNWGASVDAEESMPVQGILGEGLAKILLLSNKFPAYDSSYHLLLAKLINLYFCGESEDLQRLKQCLCVFFEHYPSLSANYKKCLSKAFIPVMRSLWPGIDGNVAMSTHMVSNMRKRAIQASRFMLQMMQAPMYTKDSSSDTNNGNNSNQDGETNPTIECYSGQEELAIRIAVEVANFSTKKTTAERSYLSALCRALVSLEFRMSEQAAVRLMRRLLYKVTASMAFDKVVMMELKQMAESLYATDKCPEERLSPDQINLILGNLELEINLDQSECMDIPPTPAPSQSTKRTNAKRRARHEEGSSSDDEVSPASVVPAIAATGPRSQRASKTAAITRMTSNRTNTIDETDNADTENSDDAESEVTSEDDSA